MTDAQVIAVLDGWQLARPIDSGVCSHAISAIETIEQVRKVINEWSHPNSHETATEAVHRIALVVSR